MTRKEILRKIYEQKLMAIIRLQENESVSAVIGALIEGGIKVLEVTLNTPNAYQHISTFSSRAELDITMGAGTVLNAEDSKKAIEAGARFIVTPCFNPSIIDQAHSQGVPVFMGAMTPTEAQNAYVGGADVIKIFPAGTLGLPYFKAIKAPLNHIPMMPTGGVNVNNVKDWLDAGAVALGVGSSLTSKEAIEKKDYARLRETAQSFIKVLEKLNT
ncbi:MAG: bifunctional 4-hydroxy-2-oxoglutarate aldolase/2-dehydro-3-deoxy-phosphogluconate aldolase [Bacteroidota bacterium]